MTDISEHLLELKRLLTKAEVISRTPGANTQEIYELLSEIYVKAGIAANQAWRELILADVRAERG